MPAGSITVGALVVVRFSERRQGLRGDVRGVEVENAVSGRKSRRSEAWLEDARFLIKGSPSRPPVTGPGTDAVVVGCLMDPRPVTVLDKTGWTQVRLDTPQGGCFYDIASGSCVRRAVYARVRGDGRVDVFGVRRGPPAADIDEFETLQPWLDELLTLGPPRETWVGELGGLNYKAPTNEDLLAAILWAQKSFPGSVIVDGTDDWNAPLKTRPEALVRRYNLRPYAWWHTGKSGRVRSGAILSRGEYGRLRHAYGREFGCDIENDPELEAPSYSKPSCGCWQGEGVRVYRR